MSVKAMSWAFAQQIADDEETRNSGKPIADARAKLLLLAIADHADDDGACWPSVLLLATKASMSRATVFRKLKELEKQSLLLVRPDEKSGRTTRYILNLSSQHVVGHPSQAETPPVSGCDGGVSPKVRHPGVSQAATQNPHLEPSRKMPPVGGAGTDLFGKKPTGKSKPELCKKEASGARAQPDPEADLYRRGEQVLGRGSGGIVTNLLRAKGGSIAKARSLIELASEKHKPREYIGACIRGASADSTEVLSAII